MEVDQTQSTVTRLLGEVRGGDRDALGELFTVVYDELQLLARRQRRRWDGDYTLNTTALVHEAYLKLVDRSRIGVESRAHFYALASRAMRHILCNYARDKQARKRGGDLRRVSFDEGRLPAGRAASPDRTSDLLAALDDALRRLEELEPRQGRVVECRFFGGLTVKETATALGVSPRTVKRDYAMAQAWLHRELEG
jgi:RNA polymerase sigma factor (TIGR02999 family)